MLFKACQLSSARSQIKKIPNKPQTTLVNASQKGKYNMKDVEELLKISYPVFTIFWDRGKSRCVIQARNSLRYQTFSLCLCLFNSQFLLFYFTFQIR